MWILFCTVNAWIQPRQEVVSEWHESNKRIDSITVLNATGCWQKKTKPVWVGFLLFICNLNILFPSQLCHLCEFARAKQSISFQANFHFHKDLRHSIKSRASICPIRGKTISLMGACWHAFFFPRFSPVRCTCFEIWLVYLNVDMYCDWPVVTLGLVLRHSQDLSDLLW